jgi:HD superfamily phosphodiesterase
MNLDPELEKRLKSIALSYLERGRGVFDTSHTLAAVRYMKALVEAEGGDERVLVTTMYFHDIGYAGLFEGTAIDLDNVRAASDIHMERGAAEAENELIELCYQPEEIQQITNLIRNHDNLERLDDQNTLESQLVFEADSLGHLNAEHTFEGEQYLEAMRDFKRKRVPRFRTETGKEFLEPLLEKISF